MNLKKLYPDISFENIRGNVDTRLEKLSRGEFDGIILAGAGIERLGLTDDIRFDYTVFDYTEFLPAPCQGIIAIESRKNDFITEIINTINDDNTYLSFETERHLLSLLNADCTAPIGAYSFVKNGKISLSVSKDSSKTVFGTDESENRFELAERLVLEL
jgi:hydroxymethylbilane synthase